jgi:two-component system, cell cycle sensor histidine kinase PleC
METFMRSAETSGVGANGFGLPDHQRGRAQGLVARLAQPFHDFAASISPTTLAVGATALLAATLSMIFDAVRTLDEERSRQSLLAHVAAIAPEPLMAAPVGPGFEGVWQRGAGAFGAAILLIVVTYRRREPARDKASDQLLASIRQEQRLLARRYHEEKLRAEAASRSKTSFLAHLSHDIRTPLNHIIGFADLMCQETYGPLGDERYLSYVEAMKLSGERLLSFFASILELAELEGGRKPLKQEAFFVDELLISVGRRFGAQAQRAGLALAIGAPCGAQLMGDRFSLERMLCNVVENAVRFTPHGGKVTVSAFTGTDGVVLEITDTGIGMSDDQLATLSQPFVFGDAALAREHGGAGLGIAIARTIAELSGGRLAIDSRMALGTTVAISLPLHEVERAEAA